MFLGTRRAEARHVSHHILLVDDEPTFRRIISRHLAHQGLEVTTASNGRDALLLALQGRFDAVLSDLQMPLMSGLELLPRLQAVLGDVPIVLMSGSQLLSGRQDALARGAFDYLRKPLELEELTRVMHRAVSRSKRSCLGSGDAPLQLAE